MKADYLALNSRIFETMADLETVVNRSELLMKKATSSSDDGYLDGVALNLHGFYAGVERIFEDIARTIEKSVPSGPHWHQDLLLQMSADADDIRPAVIRRETRYCLNEYRGFRHVVRNVYTFSLKPSRIRELTEELRECYQSLIKDLDEFRDFLHRVTDTEMG